MWWIRLNDIQRSLVNLDKFCGIGEPDCHILKLFYTGIDTVYVDSYEYPTPEDAMHDYEYLIKVLAAGEIPKRIKE